MSSFKDKRSVLILFTSFIYLLGLCTTADCQSGIITTVAGNGTCCTSGDGGPATSASVWAPAGLAVDSSGNLYIVQENHNRVRMVTPDGIISTLAGGGNAGLGDGGPANMAQLSGPWGVAVDGSGSVYIADHFDARVRRVSSGIITTVAGGGNQAFENGVPATSVGICGPYGVVVDASGDFFFTECSVDMVSSGGAISRVAGTGILSGSLANGVPATSALLTNTGGIATDASGNIFFSEQDYSSGKYVVRRFTVGGTITTIAGGGSLAGTLADGGPATSANFGQIFGLAVDGAGNLFLASGGLVRKVTPAGVISTVAGGGTLGGTLGDGGPATSANLGGPDGLAFDALGNLYISETNAGLVRKVSNVGASISSCAAIINGGIAAPTPALLSNTHPINIAGSFSPTQGYTLDEAAHVCGFTKLDWQQTIIHLNDPSPYCENNNDPTQPNPAPFCGLGFGATNSPPPFPILLTSHSVPFNDPPPNGYSDVPYYNSYPFFYPAATLESVTCVTGPSDAPYTCVNRADTTLSFFDQPTYPCTNYFSLLFPVCGGELAPSDAFTEFQTHLAGVNSNGTACDLGIGYHWTSNYNGISGGTTVLGVSNTTSYEYLGSPCTLSILYATDVAVAASGLSYSRVSRAFVGIVTITNVSQRSINGPFQIVFNSLPAGVTLMNPIGSFANSPYLTLPDISTLVPGQSASIEVQFRNPSNAQFSMSPVVYSGSFF